MAKKKNYEYVLPEGFVLRGGENDYVIEKVLGKGGFGVTYKVKTRVQYKNIRIDAFFAVKEYFPDICSRQSDNATIKIPETKQKEIVDGKKDFINEGLKLQQVCKLNPNIVNVNEVFEANDTAYYVLEYLEGGDLRKLVQDNGTPLTEKQMLDVMLPVGYALQCLHDNRMLHLDVKPDNIVMRVDNSDNSMEPALIDFGIAIHFNNDGTPTSKTPSQGISPGYSPIEQYAQINSFDPRIDVYAYCATCYYLLTGKDPIVSMEMTPDFVRSGLPQGISSHVVDAIEHGMSMNKNIRTSTIEEVLRGLENLEAPELPEIPPKEEPEELPNKSEKDTVKLGVLSQPKLAVPNDPKPEPEEIADPNAARLTPNDKVDANTSKPEPKEKADPNATRLASGGNGLAKNGKGVLSPQKLLIGVAIVAGLIIISGIFFFGVRSCHSYEGQMVSNDMISNEMMSGSVEAKLSRKADSLLTRYFNSMIYVEGGTFTMGNVNNEGTEKDDIFDGRPAHSVTLSSYHIGKTEVTQEFWEAVMGYNPSRFKGANRPVDNVSWEDCQEFIKRLNNSTSGGLRLPTEAEWEYAARGGNMSLGYIYSGSDNLDEVAWYEGNSGNETHDVATKVANELGIYDMSGNVEEWCSDWYGHFSNSSQTNPTGPNTGPNHVKRGGSWYVDKGMCRVANRIGMLDSTFKEGYFGFRLVFLNKEIEAEAKP